MYTLYNVIKILILSTNRLYSKRASRVYFEQRPRAACAWDAISGWDAVSGHTRPYKNPGAVWCCRRVEWTTVLCIGHEFVINKVKVKLNYTDGKMFDNT